MTNTSMKRFSVLLAALLLTLTAASCGDKDEKTDAGTQTDTDASVPEQAPLYVADTVVTDGENSQMYVVFLDSLEPQAFNYEDAREFPGGDDLWVHNGVVYISDLDSFTIEKFLVEGHTLVSDGKISFASYGLTDMGFWVNTFVADDKAYLINGTKELIVWDPIEMEITGTVPMPELAKKGKLEPFGSYSDRSTLVRDGLLYQPIYYTDETYFKFAPSSTLLVLDIDSDTLVDTIDLPCPGVDFATRDDDDNLYFSTWVFAPGGAALLEQPSTCVAKLAAGADAAEVLFDVSDVTDGREGGAFRYLGGDKALMSVLHRDNTDETDVQDVTYGANWRFWSYDMKSGAAEVVDAFDWNAGAAYGNDIDGVPYMLAPTGDYSRTKLYRLAPSGEPTQIFDTKGWALRVFQVH